MPQTTMKLRDAAIFLQHSADALFSRTKKSLKTLSQTEIIELLNKVQELTLKSSELLALEVIQIEQEAKDAFENLAAVKGNITEAIKKIESVQKVIDLATKIVSFASALIAKDIQKIISTGQEVISGIAGNSPQPGN